jgi:tRNA A-37 threonylcarbamoyl transferase component Bud32
MNAPGPLIASGRDADIFEYGAGRVLRRSRERKSMTEEARVMAFARDRGYPVPRIDELSDDGTELVMERVAGPTMLELISQNPSLLVEQAESLRSLHQRLHEIAAPSWLRTAPFSEGNALLHLDLHPINVIVSDSGPVVIDWSNASRGDANADVALTWLLMASGEISATDEMAELISIGRGLLIETFLEGSDFTKVAAQLPDAVAWKLNDPHMNSAERRAMRQLLLKTQS